MEATLLLCDAAEAINGKLYILGGGWSITGPMSIPSALALKIDVPWSEANRKIHAKVELMDADGGLVSVPDQFGNEQPVQIEFDFEVGRPPGLAPGTPLDATVALNIPPLPLSQGSRFTWRLEVDGASKPHWQVAFATRNAP
jgi:hypothetical protein